MPYHFGGYFPIIGARADIGNYEFFGDADERSADALEKRVPFRQEHLSRLQSLKDDGVLITLGPTEGSTHVFGIFEADAIGTVRQLVEDDIYWKQGIWTALEVYPWIQAF